MKILFCFGLIFAFAVIGLGQVQPKPSPENTVVFAAPDTPVKTGENPEAVEFRDRGINFYMKSDNDSAIAKFNEAIRKDPNFADAYNRRGAAYANKKDHKQAILDYNKAINLSPKFITPYINRAGSYMFEKNYQSAVNDYSKLIELNPPLAAFYYDRRADAYTAMKRKDLASADRKKAKELKKSGFVLNNF